MNVLMLRFRVSSLLYAVVMVCSLSQLQAGRDAILYPASPQHWFIGVFGGVNLNSHTGTYSLYDGSQACCTFTSGSGTGMVLGVRAYIPLAEQVFLEPRLSFEGRGGLLSGNDYVQMIRGQGNTLEPGTFRNELETDLPYFSLDILGGYTLLPKIGLYVCGGVNIGGAASTTYEEFESIVSPKDVFYNGTTSTRQRVFNGDLPNFKSLQLGLRAGLGANIHVYRKWYLSPEVLYHFPIGTYSSENGSDWKSSIVQCTIGLTLQL